MAQLPNIIERDHSVWKVIKFVFIESIKGSKKYSTIRYVATVFAAIFAFAQFGALAIIVNEFVTYGIAGARHIILLKGFILLVVSDFVPTLIDSISNYATSTQGCDVARHIQSLLFQKMHDLDIGTIEQPELQNILEVSMTRGRQNFFNTIWHITSFFRQGAYLSIAVIALLKISPLVLIVILLAAVPSYFIEKHNGIVLNKLYKQTAEGNRAGKAKSTALHNKNELIELKNFNIVNIFKKKFIEIISVFNEQERVILKKYRTNDIYGKLILIVAFGISFYLLINKVYLGSLAVGSLVFSVSVVTKFQSAIEQVFDSIGKISEYRKSIGTFIDFLEMESLVKSGTKKISRDDFRKLELKNVSFMYPGSDKNVIYNINLVIEKSVNLAIVGLNGAGKTTLLKLITRVYDPTEGEILVNGVNLKEYSLDDWKQCMGILLQEYTMYSEETISENVMLGDVKKHDQGFVEEVCRQTTAHEFISELPEKYEQKIGTEFRGGVELSKGQKQKLALARVLYRNAPIIILDEPTAAIDALSEDTIFKSFRENHTDQTRIIISHKFSNVRDADNIILIEHGQIIEQGSHEQLMSIDNGRYKELFELQAEGYK